MADPHLLMVLVDALRHDQITAAHAPFLATIATDGSAGAAQEVFAGQLRPAFMAGLYPNESGVGHLFCYDPANSPFRPARFIPGIVDRCPPLSWRARRALTARACSVEARRGHRGSASYCYTAEIPLRRLPLFAFSETELPWEDWRQVRPGLLSILSAQGRAWLHLGYPVVDQRTRILTQAALSRIRASHALVFLHYAELDWAGHQYGPHSTQAHHALRAIDGALQEVWRQARSLWPEAKLLVFGDHGMVQVRHEVNVEAALARVPLRHNRDYAVFLDSTVARFWFLRERARSAITSCLLDLPGGRWLSPGDLDELHLRGGRPQNGEAFWLVDEGVVIMPSFFQRRDRPAGMHGYHPSVQDNWGTLLTSDGSGPTDAVPLTKVFSTACTMLGLGSAGVRL